MWGPRHSQRHDGSSGVHTGRLPAIFIKVDRFSFTAVQRMMKSGQEMVLKSGAAFSKRYGKKRLWLDH